MKKVLLFVVAVAVLSGCAKKQLTRPSTGPVTTPESAQAEPSTKEPSIRFSDWRSMPELSAVRFDYDSSELSEGTRNVLSRNAEHLKSNPDMNVLVEGHCDERGTTEYNLALGQRRASAVRGYYINLGIPANRIATISFGEESPADDAHNDAAWSQNRRAETKVRSGNES